MEAGNNLVDALRTAAAAVRYWPAAVIGRLVLDGACLTWKGERIDNDARR
jgi:hypothetical protein